MPHQLPSEAESRQAQTMLAAADAHGLASDVRRGLGRDPARDAMAYPLDQAAAFFAAGNLDGADEELGRAEAEISRTVSTYEARARRLRDAGVPCADAERSAAACRGFRARVGALREFSHYRQAGGELAMLSRTCTELEQAAGNSGIGHAAEAAGIEGGGRRATMAAFSFGRAADSLLRAELAQARDILLSAAESFDLAGAGLREAFRNGDTAASAPAIAATHFRDECRRLVSAIHGTVHPPDADGIRLAPGDTVQVTPAEPRPDGLPHPGDGTRPPHGLVTGVHGGLVSMAAFPGDPGDMLVIPAGQVRQAPPGVPQPRPRHGTGRESSPAPGASRA